ncbi:MAG: SAM-dependent methyltransferase [Deltaproteobacteria bacterium]|nr:SAM-dependent methyltransferase [Deltaproteobacteria bacterium]
MFVLHSVAPRASRTAQFMALFRALESCRPATQRLFCDPYATLFLPPSLRLAVWVASLPLVGALVPWFIDRRWPGARSSGAARTRLIDDEVGAALRRGIAQVVLLGAGFDARAHRLPGIERARVFEVDRSATMGAKLAALRSRMERLPDHVVPVEVDFERNDLQQALAAAGFRREVPAMVVWEGVTNYLTAEAVDATLRAIAELTARGSRLLFTYVHRGVLDGSTSFDQTRRLSATLRRVGEPWRFGLDPAEVGAYLAARGFELLADQGAREYRARYFGEPGQGYEFYRAALAERDHRGAGAASEREDDSRTRQPCPK